MRRSLTLLAIPFSFTLSAQVAADVLSPPELQGSYVHSWAEPGTDSWSTPDMLLVENRVIGDLALAVDATAADSLACEAIANPGDIAGKIALIYRGTCNYSVKAKHCQDAGAIAVVLINNVATAPPPMGAGSQGTLVTIPVFQIAQADGATIRAAMDMGTTVTMLLGNKDGYYADDIGLNKYGVVMPQALSTPRVLAAYAGERVIQIGAWVRNPGTNTRTDAQLTATVMHNGGELYNETSDAVTILPGDSVFVELPAFEQSSYDGDYDLTYTASFAGDDGHTLDNTRSIQFNFGDIYALVDLDDEGLPEYTIGIQPADNLGDYESCIHFQDPHASRVTVEGIHFYGSQADPGDMEDELIISRVYLWLDDFTGLSDPNFTITTLAEIHYQKHFLTDTGNFVTPYLEFDDPVLLEDDERYLICIQTFNTGVFFGYNEDINMEATEIVYDQPTSTNRNVDSWFLGFVGGPVASHGAQMGDISTGVADREYVDAKPYPNPSTGIFQLSLEGHGVTVLTLSDATGRVIATDRTNDALYTMDLSGQPAGVYLLSMQSDKGKGVARLVLR
ncbi:MAG: T9SS type A sorting domain-containing protein [Flavobacteriales bacterium]|nr:T9SS type A sorting domain-containing protein [Flavobacteriales bacterium]